jgi:DSF synthase
VTLLDMISSRRLALSDSVAGAQSLRSRIEPKTSGPALDGQYETIDVELDSNLPIFWCWMCPLDKPIVTDKLLMDLKTMHRSLPAVLDAQAANPVKYYVFASRSRGTYSLGGDLRFFAESVRTGNRAAIHAYAHRCIDVVWQHVSSFDRPLITVALVQGDALGGGFETALSCDVIVAEKSAKMGLPEVLFNLFPGMGAYSFLTRRVGPAEAHRLVTSGTVYTAEQLHRLGIVDVLVEDGEGVYGLRDYVKDNERRFNAQRAGFQARKRVNPVTEAELRDIVDIWVDAVFHLTETDLKRMARLINAQERRRYSPGAHQVAAE